MADENWRERICATPGCMYLPRRGMIYCGRCLDSGYQLASLADRIAKQESEREIDDGEQELSTRQAPRP